MTAGGRPRMLQIAAVDFTVFHLLLPLLQAASQLCEVHVACADGPLVPSIRDAGFTVHTLAFSRSLRPAGLVRAAVDLNRLLKTEDYDIIHTHTPLIGAVGRFVTARRRVPCVVQTVHGFYSHERMNPLIRRPIEMVERSLARTTRFSFFQSMEDYDLALKKGICTPESGLHIGNGVDLSRFDPGCGDLAKDGAGLRAESGLSADDVVITMVARMVREKGGLDLVRAFALLKGAHPEARLWLIGQALPSDRDGVDGELRALASSLGLGGSVRFLGARRDVETVLAASDIFVLPSHREGMPRSIIEAMAMGLPVAATRIRGCREEVVPDITGFLVPPGNPDALAEALGALLADGALRARMGQAGLDRARAIFDERKVVAKQLAVYERLLSARKTGRRGGASR